ncbi:E3 ubiquitin-protein ligase RNF169 [Sander lucioperca]|uniref:RING-type E3 ubiquitin transferase n=1 Tax=Sander lucioperca TaxID=283035 RepID=A0A8C9ZCB0_SANLU|nr:E3 ubiquitin-protein ligase RNF169 [Sander lucioperca]
MATAGSAERPGRPARAAANAGKYRSGSRSGAGCVSGSSPPENEAKKRPAYVEGQRGGGSGSPPCGQPAACQRRSSSRERLRRRSDPEKSSSRPAKRDYDTRKEFFVSPALVPKCCDVLSGPTGKHKLLSSEDREDVKRRHDEEPGVLSDSENEEPISRRIRNISAFIRKTKTSAAFTGGSQRSQSCTDPVEERGRKLKVITQPALMDRVGISHSFTAGILLSSENSRSVSAPITAPDRRHPWRPVLSSSSTPLTLVAPAPRAELSASPDSNDSISEELNHFKPIVCSPCTPPKRLADGRLLEPAIVKSTPRNLTRGLQKATSYEASPAVLQKWRQIELDRQSLKVSCKATLTSPVGETHGGADAKTHPPPAAPSRDGDGVATANKRRLLFEPPAGDADAFPKQSVKIRVPAVRYSGEAAFRGSSDFELTVGAPESCGGNALFGRRRSFSPYTKNSGFQSCKSASKDPKDSKDQQELQSPRKECDSGLRNTSTSRRGQKREQKTKHLDSERDSERKRSRSAGQDAFEERYVGGRTQQERRDRAIALKLQRQFDMEDQATSRRRSPQMYFLRSWMSNQNRRRRGLRRSRRINKKH